MVWDALTLAPEYEPSGEKEVGSANLCLPHGVRRRGLPPAVGKTQTLPLEVQAQFEDLNLQGAYAASLVLALCAVLTLVALTLTRPRHEKEARRGNRNRRGLEAVR